MDRPLLKDLLLIAFALVTISLVPINTEISWDHMLLMGTALAVAVVVPYLVSRFGYRDHAVRFPIRGPPVDWPRSGTSSPSLCSAG